MGRRTKLRPLTDAEERCLIKLADHRDTHKPWKPYSDDGFVGGSARNITTLCALADRGYLVIGWGGFGWGRAQITDAGYELVRGMGD